MFSEDYELYLNSDETEIGIKEDDSPKKYEYFCNNILVIAEEWFYYEFNRQCYLFSSTYQMCKIEIKPNNNKFT